MSLRKALGGMSQTVHARLDEVLDSEDVVILLADGRGMTTYLHGFGASGCQLEMLAAEVEAAVRQLVGPGEPA